jgi:capsule polysaccharide export protein KpsE/RkpR
MVMEAAIKFFNALGWPGVAIGAVMYLYQATENHYTGQVAQLSEVRISVESLETCIKGIDTQLESIRSEMHNTTTAINSLTAKGAVLRSDLDHVLRGETGNGNYSRNKARK